ncbi:MAG: hypothetical protein AAGA78_17705, partial [Pseudomonadota bacterium]
GRTDTAFPSQVSEETDRKALPLPVGAEPVQPEPEPEDIELDTPEQAVAEEELSASFMAPEHDLELPSADAPPEIETRPLKEAATKPELYVVETPNESPEPTKPAGALQLEQSAPPAPPEPDAEPDAGKQANAGLLGRILGRGSDDAPSVPQEPDASTAPTAADAKRSGLRIIRNEPDQPAAPPEPLQLGEVDFDENDEPNLRNFAVFNKAETLTDLVEVAAAYTTIIEGQASFSRRALLERIDEVAADKKYSAEVRIKSFGKLLRAGKIIRVDDGQFALSGDALRDFEERLAG